ncbi:nucleotidyltransferase family protein [Halalkalibacter alkalisediminis]|uniref:Nucleotidyltransferase family protein n=1 Tax=Halalkalibacter alkalisediminis TaxID=935616 RepID=A0ABV6NP01_9BACI
MRIENEEDLMQTIAEDEWMMNILRAVKTLDLPDWWICAGFVRSKIWDVLHDYRKRTPIKDIDVIYFDLSDQKEKTEKEFEKKLHSLMPTIPWSVKNQARMHVINKLPPYSSSTDGIAHFPETATALGVKLGEDGLLKLTTPWGLHDAIHLDVKPTPPYLNKEEMTNL